MGIVALFVDAERPKNRSHARAWERENVGRVSNLPYDNDGRLETCPTGPTSRAYREAAVVLRASHCLAVFG